MNQRVIIAVAAAFLVAAGLYFSGIFTSQYDNLTRVEYITPNAQGEMLSENYRLVSNFLKRENKHTWEDALPHRVPDLTLKITLSDNEVIERSFYDDKENQQVILSNQQMAAALYYDEPSLDALLDASDFKKIAETTTQNIHLEFNQNLITLSPTQTEESTYRMGKLQNNSYSDENAIAFLTLTEPNQNISINLDNIAENISYQLEVLDQDKNQLVDVVSSTFTPLNIAGKTVYKLHVILEQADILSTKTIASDYLFEVDLDVPAIASINTTSQPSGGFFMIHADFVKPLDTLILEQNILEETPEFTRIDKEAFVIIPLDYWSVVGDYNIKVKIDGVDGTHKILDQVVTVTERDYGMQNLTIDTSIDNSTRTNDAYAEYHEKFMPVRLTSADEQYWEGPFIVPAEGRITTDYGERRTVNNELTSYRHNGIDYGAPEGADILASNTGKIVFAEPLTLTGNTVVIDHGLGLFSYYLHASKLNVKVGQMVKKGDVIAQVGTTGFSTGPHLHFTTSYHLSNIDPLNLLEWNGEWPK